MTGEKRMDRARNRGTIIVLVVAVLALLAVLGTAYIVSARMERGTTRAMSDNLGLEMARDAVMNTVRATMVNQTLRSTDGALMAMPAGWSTGVKYQVFNPAAPLAGGLVLGSDYRIYKNITGPATPSDLTAHGPPPGNTTDWALLTATDVPSGTIAARGFDYPEMQATAGWANFGKGVADLGIPDQPWLVKKLYYPGDNTPDFTLLSPKRFDASAGTSTLPYGGSPPTSGDTVVVDPNSLTPDGVWNMLSFSSGSGIRYRYALRIIDTNSMANLNVGQTFGTPDATGTYLTSLNLADPQLVSDSAAAVSRLQYQATAPFGRCTSPTAPTLQSWQQTVLGYERFGINPAASLTTPIAQWFDLSDELELRSNGTWGNSYLCRPATANMLVNSLKGGTSDSNRKRFTTYSFDRNVTNISNNGAATFPTHWTFNGVNWPADNKPINLRISSPAQAVATTAYLANAMYAAGYSEDEALAFAVNYLSQVDGSTAGKALIMPAGLVVNGGLAAAINPAPTRTYLGYSAQPFLNEVALHTNYDSINKVTVIDDFAVELYNPYPQPIDLSNWQVQVGGTMFYTFPSGTSILGNDGSGKNYMVLELANLFAPAATATQVGLSSSPAPATIPLSSTVTLVRPYLDQAAASQLITVDKLPYAFSGQFVASSTPVSASVQRNNYSVSATPTAAAAGRDDWMATSPAASNVTSLNVTLGAINDVTAIGDATRFGIILPDRWCGASPRASGLNYGVIDANIGDLIYNPRICNQLLSNGSSATVTDQLADANTVVSFSNCPQESKVRFDYLYDPRAQRFFQYVAAIDRASDGADQLGNGNGGDTIDEIRMPGRVNVNTASGAVLHAVVSNFQDDSAANNFMASKMVCNILAYRDRLANATFNSQTSTADFSLIPGRGIRSLTELLIPIGAADGSFTVSGAGVTAAGPMNTRSLVAWGGRTANWIRMCAMCTTRSDTFVVYGYMEAIKVHPKYAGAHNNGMDWYRNYNDDPTTAGPPNLLMARRRWVAIVDRSWCNYPRTDTANFILPKVVAIRDLPR